jgi:hypothetical protein
MMRLGALHVTSLLHACGSVLAAKNAVRHLAEAANVRMASRAT